MKLPPIRDFINFQYSRPAHVVLLVLLLVVWFVQAVIAAISGFELYVVFYYACGIVAPVAAGSLVILRARPFAEQFQWFPGDTVVIELIGYVIHTGLNIAALFLLDIVLRIYKGAKPYGAMIFACTVLEGLLETLLVYKLVVALVHLWCYSQEQTDKTLAELKGKGGSAPPAEAVAHVSLINEAA